ITTNEELKDEKGKDVTFKLNNNTLKREDSKVSLNIFQKLSFFKSPNNKTRRKSDAEVFENSNTKNLSEQNNSNEILIKNSSSNSLNSSNTSSFKEFIEEDLEDISNEEGNEEKVKKALKNKSI